MKGDVLINMERQRYPNSGLGYYCRCLEQGLREILEDQACSSLVYPSVSYYRPSNGEDSLVEEYSSLHKFFNPKPRGYKLLHVSHQLDRYFLNSYSIKRIVTLHDLNFLREELPPRKKAKLFDLCRRNLEKAEVIVCISRFVYDDLLVNKHLFNLKEQVRIEVIHNGIIFKKLEVKEDASSFPELEGEDFMLSIGVLHRKKQQHRLVEALAHLPKHLKLVLVYSDKKLDYFQEILETVEQNQLKDRVLFYSNISDVQKSFLFKNMKALLHPSIAEGFGIPPIEAMAEGKPVFLSRATSLPEVGGGEAFYFNSDDSSEGFAQTILEGLANFEEDKEKAQRLKAWAMRYDYRKMAQNYLNLYLEVLK